MSGLKYLVIVLLVETARTVPLPSKHVRSANFGQTQPSPSYIYPVPLPYQQQQQQFPFQQPILFNQQPRTPFPNGPPGNAQIYPINQQNYPINQQSYPFYPSPYPSFNPVYPSFRNYQPYPSYPSYPTGPFQSNFPNYPDPFAGIPTEIIDVDENGNFDPELSWDDLLSKVEISSSHHTTASDPILPFSNTQIVENKPIQTTITRTFESGSSEPVVDIKYSDPAANTGSGKLIEAEENETETEDENNNNENDVNEEKTEADDEDKKDSIFSWG